MWMVGTHPLPVKGVANVQRRRIHHHHHHLIIITIIMLMPISEYSKSLLDDHADADKSL